jgi:hypothetical protein
MASITVFAVVESAGSEPASGPVKVMALVPLEAVITNGSLAPAPVEIE